MCKIGNISITIDKVKKNQKSTHPYISILRYQKQNKKHKAELEKFISDASCYLGTISKQPSGNIAQWKFLDGEDYKYNEFIGKFVDKDALGRQEGGNHYKDLAIQPAEYCHKNKLDGLSGAVIKYMTRWPKKNGKEDLLKARHTIDLLIQLEYGEEE